MGPLISVIVPIYKVEHYLPKCIDSILEQIYRDLDIILVDDGSPDRCGQICDEYFESVCLSAACGKYRTLCALCTYLGTRAVHGLGKLWEMIGTRSTWKILGRGIKTPDFLCAIALDIVFHRLSLLEGASA